MGCGSSVAADPLPSDAGGAKLPTRVADMNPAELQVWLKGVGLVKQASALEGVDGEWLASASDADLSTLQGLGAEAQPLRQALLKQVRLREGQGAHAAFNPPDIPKESGAEAVANRVVAKVEEAEEVRRAAVKVLECAPGGVADLIASAAESALSAAESLPLVGPACKIIHDIYKSVKQARDNRKSCEHFGETLRKIEVILLKAARLDKPATQIKGLESALLTAAEFLQSQSSQGWMQRLILGESSSERFRELQSAIVEELRLVQAETLLDVAGGVEDLLSRLAGSAATEAAEGEDAETRRAVKSKIEELGGWEAVKGDNAALDAVAAVMSAEGRVLRGDILMGFENVKESVDRVKAGVEELVDSGPHDLIKHADARRLWARKFRGLEKVMRETFAHALLNALEENLVPGLDPPLDEKSSKELAVAVDADASGKITVVEVHAAFPGGQSFPECVTQLLAGDGTLSLPMPPAVFLGRGAHLDAAMDAWRGGGAAGSLVVVAPGGVGKSAFAVTLARRAIDEGFASRASFMDARGSCATQASLLSALGAACRVRVDGADDTPLINWASGWGKGGGARGGGGVFSMKINAQLEHVH
jgi:hypothetical protein